MFLFLQSWRATLIPSITVPVVILGTFAVLYVLGFSINTLTLFALVLAIGLLVDDAIVVRKTLSGSCMNSTYLLKKLLLSRWGKLVVP
jgi:multidrug efflux pump subunit AcrB